MRNKRYPLYVIVNNKNVAVDYSNDFDEATDISDFLNKEYQEYGFRFYVKLFFDHKGDKSKIGF